MPWQNSVFKSLEISLEGKVICQVEKEGIVVDPLEVTDVCHTGCSIKKTLQIRKWMSSVCCSHLRWLCLGFIFHVTKSACVVCLEQNFQTAGKPVYPLGFSHISSGAHGAQSGLVSSWRVPTNIYLHTGVRMKGCKATLDRLHFEHFKEMGKTWMLWKGGG